MAISRESTADFTRENGVKKLHRDQLTPQGVIPSTGPTEHPQPLAVFAMVRSPLLTLRNVAETTAETCPVAPIFFPTNSLDLSGYLSTKNTMPPGFCSDQPSLWFSVGHTTYHCWAIGFYCLSNRGPPPVFFTNQKRTSMFLMFNQKRCYQLLDIWDTPW